MATLVSETVVLSEDRTMETVTTVTEESSTKKDESGNEVVTKTVVTNTVARPVKKEKTEQEKLEDTVAEYRSQVAHKLENITQLTTLYSSKIDDSTTRDAVVSLMAAKYGANTATHDEVIAAKLAHDEVVVQREDIHHKLILAQVEYEVLVDKLEEVESQYPENIEKKKHQLLLCTNLYKLLDKNAYYVYVQKVQTTKYSYIIYAHCKYTKHSVAGIKKLWVMHVQPSSNDYGIGINIIDQQVSNYYKGYEYLDDNMQKLFEDKGINIPDDVWKGRYKLAESSYLIDLLVKHYPDGFIIRHNQATGSNKLL